MDGGATETFVSTHIYEKIHSDMRPVLQPDTMGHAELAGPGSYIKMWEEVLLT